MLSYYTAALWRHEGVTKHWRFVWVVTPLPNSPRAPFTIVGRSILRVDKHVSVNSGHNECIHRSFERHELLGTRIWRVSYILNAVICMFAPSGVFCLLVTDRTTRNCTKSRIGIRWIVVDPIEVLYLYRQFDNGYPRIRISTDVLIMKTNRFKAVDE